METPALVTMIIGMVVIWGGLAASIARAVQVARRRDDGDEPAAAAPDDAAP